MGWREVMMKTPYRLQTDDDADSREETWARVLKANYGEAAQEPLPDRLRELLEQLDDAEARDR
jgi:hypothetical protein